MKRKLNYLKRLIKHGRPLKKLEYILKKQGNHFQLFPYYWELLPVRLEKAMTRNNIETTIHQQDNFRLHKDDF
jgi:hypothetical protein